MGWANLWQLEEKFEQDVTISVSDPRIETQVGVRTEHAITVNGFDSGYIIYGPRISVSAGAWKGCVRLTEGAKRNGEIVLDVCSDYGERIFAQIELDFEHTILNQDLIEISFDTSVAVKNLELRLFTKLNAIVSVAAIQFMRVDLSDQVLGV